MAADTIQIKPFAAVLTAVLAIEAVIILTAKMVSVSVLLLIGIGRLVEIVVTAAIVQRVTGGMAAIGLDKKSLAPGIVKGVVWSLGFGAFVLIAFTLIYFCGENPFHLFRMKLPDTAHELALFFLVGGIIGPIAEEVVFRGVFYGFLRKWGVAAALIGSTTCFVLLHNGFGVTQIVGGFLFAIAYEIEGKLMTPIIIHSCGNMALFCLPLLPI